MVADPKCGFGISAGFGTSRKCNFGTPGALYKRVPIYPLVSPAVDHFHSNSTSRRSACTNCFPLPAPAVHENYVDMLEFSEFGGIPWPLAPGVRRPSRWFADFRYTLATPLPHKYPSVWNEVVNSGRVSAVMQREMEANSSLTLHSLRKRVSGYFSEMKASLSRVVCKICAYVLFKVFRRLMTRLLVSPQQMKRLQEANDTGIPLVYLPLHRSHLDYLLITWAAWHFGLPLPHIASGDNLNLSGFGWLLRATGAFFIRRRVDPNDDSGKDALYRAVLHSYIEQLLSKGLTIEFFLEGTRSRYGKSLLPKHGLISNVVEAVQQGTIKDCYLVPVSYTYDQVAEGVFLNELMGIPKVRESVMGVLRGILKGFGVSKRCGAVRMHYGHPILLSDYLTTLKATLSTSSSRTPSPLSRLSHSYSYRELVPWHHGHQEEVCNRRLIRAIGYHIVYESQSIVSISLVSVISALLLCKFRQGVTLEILAADVQWLCEMIIMEGSDVMGWRDRETSGKSAIEYVMPFIRESVDRLDDIVEPIRSHRQLVHLAYSKNAMVPLFAVKSVIALAIVSNKKSVVAVHDLIDDVLQMCDWLQNEVIFCKPCDNLRNCISGHITEMSSIHGGLLRRVVDEMAEESGDAFTATIQPRDDDCRSVLIFYSNILRPFLQSLYMVCRRLADGSAGVKESEFIRNLCKDSLASVATMQFEPQLESINSDSFKNSLRLLREWGAVKGPEPMVQVPNPNEIGLVADKVLERLHIY